MSAEYVSPKKDGYLSVRNEVYRDREVKAQEALRAQMEKDKVPAPMNKDNYGFGKIKY